MAPLPDEVRRLIADRLYSAEAVEVLLLLRGAPSAWWTAEDVSRRRRTQIADAELRLRRLVGAELLVGDGAARYRYAPATADLRKAVDALATRYRTHRVAVATLIYRKPVDAELRFDRRIGLG